MFCIFNEFIGESVRHLKVKCNYLTFHIGTDQSTVSAWSILSSLLRLHPTVVVRFSQGEGYAISGVETASAAVLVSAGAEAFQVCAPEVESVHGTFPVGGVKSRDTVDVHTNESIVG
jgi:hypothetical protein